MLDTQELADRVAIKLNGELTIQYADALKQELLAVLAKGKPVELDLSEVSELDSSGVQLLYYAKQAANRQALGFELRQHSPAVIEVFELYRLAPIFGDPMVLGAALPNAEPRAAGSKPQAGIQP